MSRENINYQEIADRIKLTRKALKLTQDEFGRRIDMKRQDTHNLETGKRHPGLVVLHRIALEFNLSLDWLILGVNKTEDILFK